MQPRVPKFCVVPLCITLLSCMAVAAAADTQQPQTEKAAVKTEQARLEVAVKEDRGSWLVTVTLRNTGDVPLIVDRNLVMGVTLEVVGLEGARIQKESKPVSATSTCDEARKRLIALAPRQAVSREISLKAGWRELQGGQGIDSDQRTIAVTGYEEVARLPKDAQPRAIRVRYGSTGNFQDGFLGFTGLSAEEAGLYLGPLEQAVNLVAGP